MSARIDGFVGSHEQYVSYLEKELLSSRRQNLLLNGSAQPSTPGYNVSGSACDLGNAISKRRHGPTSNETGDSACEMSDAASVQPHEKRLKRPRELEFIMLDPGTITLNPIKAYIPIPRWKANAKALIAETPKAEDWYSSLKEQGIYDIISNGQAVEYLMAVDEQSPVVPATTASLGSSVSDRLRGYALAATRRGSAASTALKLVNFQKFLVLSACYVLRQTNEQDCIGEVISLCIGRKVTQNRVDELLKTCCFVNRLLHSLYVQGWGLRGCELFLLWNRPPTFFDQLCHAKESSLRFFKDSIGTREFTNIGETPLHWTSLFVPILVDHIIGGSIAVDRISELLGYTDSYFTRDNPWQYLRENSQS